jgi:S-adenosylmethionine decarboxylase
MVYSAAMRGLHLTADLYQCRCEDLWLTDARQLADWCLQAVRAVGLEPAGQLSHSFVDSGGGADGVTVTVLLPGSHVCLHAWAGRRAVTADVYVCDFGGDHSAKARGLMFALINRFQPAWTEQRSLDRGGEDT